MRNSEPNQANVRRAVSSAYYALFHLLIRDAILNWKHPSHRSRLARTFDHKRMKEASTAFLKEPGKIHPSDDERRDQKWSVLAGSPVLDHLSTDHSFGFAVRVARLPRDGRGEALLRRRVAKAAARRVGVVGNVARKAARPGVYHRVALCNILGAISCNGSRVRGLGLGIATPEESGQNRRNEQEASRKETAFHHDTVAAPRASDSAWPLMSCAALLHDPRPTIGQRS